MSDLLHIRIARGAAANTYRVTLGIAGEDVVDNLPVPVAQALIQVHERAPGLRLDDPVQYRAACISVGAYLFDTFITGSVRVAYDAYFRQQRAAGQPVRLGLSLARDLYSYPWELLADRRERPEFVALSGALTRYDDEAADSDQTYVPAASDLELLAIRSTPNNYIAVAPASLRSKGRIKFIEIDPATFPRFQEHAANAKQHGFVFFGHGTVDKTTKRGTLLFVRQEGFVFVKHLRADPRDGEAIGIATGSMQGAFLACLIACESAWAQKGIPFESTVTGALLDQTRLMFVIGAQTALDAVAGSLFLEEVLGCLSMKVPLDLAISAGRRAIATDTAQGFDRHRLDWWVPAIYAKTRQLDVLIDDYSTQLPAIVPEDSVVRNAGNDIALGLRGAVAALSRGFTRVIDPPAY